MFCISVKVKLTVLLLCVCVHSAWKGHSRNDLYCVGWDIKPYSLTFCQCSQIRLHCCLTSLQYCVSSIDFVVINFLHSLFFQTLWMTPVQYLKEPQSLQHYTFSELSNIFHCIWYCVLNFCILLDVASVLLRFCIVYAVSFTRTLKWQLIFRSHLFKRHEKCLIWSERHNCRPTLIRGCALDYDFVCYVKIRAVKALIFLMH